MKILQVCFRFPYPPNDGGAMAMDNLTQGLIECGNQVKLISLNTKKHFVDVQSLPKEYLAKTSPETVTIDTSVRLLPAFFNLFSKDSYNITRFISTGFKEKIKKILQKDSYDIVQLESLFVTPYIDTIRENSNAKIVLRAANIEHEIWQKMADNCKNPIKKAYLGFLAKRLKAFEANIIGGVDAIASITAEDAVFFRQMGFKKKMIVIPFGLQESKFISQTPLNKVPTIYHLGSMDWLPNQEGMKWFLETVWKKFLLQNSQLKCCIAGRNMPNEFFNLKMDRLFVDGEIKDSELYIQDKTILVVPLFSGSGMRAKIIEAMAAGKTVISTTLGAQGIRYENGKNILIADTARAFLDQLEKCASDPSFCHLIGEQAKLMAQENYSNKYLCKALDHFYTDLINN